MRTSGGNKKGKDAREYIKSVRTAAASGSPPSDQPDSKMTGAEAWNAFTLREGPAIDDMLKSAAANDKVMETTTLRIDHGASNSRAIQHAAEECI